ncbi:carboxypeptidase-like regulatory domain-containing protein [Chryseolinea soli]|uniref:Carboxypeptidase-like regulatory domain-containing protein n=2 Tax=Chryseolinea soli TaxID=2321403 RepID=A0A385SXB8_9BACT|nr:carboxypeptidase-like regulatory domain-containing protein [Chryseolinea soli]
MSKPTSAQIPSARTNTEVVQHPEATASERAAIKEKQVIRGVVKSDEDHSPLPGVNVYLKGSMEHTFTDADGRFEFPRKLKEGDVLIFNFIGLEPQERVIQRLTDPLEVSMPPAYLALMGAVAVDQTYKAKPSGVRRLWEAIKAIF